MDNSQYGVVLLHPEKFQLLTFEQDYEWYPEDERIFGDATLFDEKMQQIADNRLIYKILVASAKGNVKIPPLKTEADYSELFYNILSEEWKQIFENREICSYEKLQNLLEESIQMEEEFARMTKESLDEKSEQNKTKKAEELQARKSGETSAEQGIIFIDEIDKIAKKKNSSQRDVSGESVQQGMLKLLEGSEVEVPVGANSKNAMVPLTTVNTKNILFICGGAFPDLEDIIKERLQKKTSMGFNAELRDTVEHDENLLSKVTVEDLRKFGMIPEFLGRLPIIFTLKGLNKDMLVKILKEPKNAILKQYQKLLALDEVKLDFNDGALEAIAEKAIEKDTGARALRAIIEEFMLDIMYEIPKDDNIGEVTITREYIEGTGGPIIQLRGQEVPKLNG